MVKKKVRRHVQQERAHWHLHPPGARGHHRAVQAEEGPQGVEEEDQVGLDGRKWKIIRSGGKWNDLESGGHGLSRGIGGGAWPVQLMRHKNEAFKVLRVR